MENEPPEHTRLRRPVAGAFNRGHVERLRPRVRELAARAARRGGPAPASTSSRDYAEPLPVLVIAELLGVPATHAPRPARRGRRRSCGCTSRRRPPTCVDAAVAAASEFAGAGPRAGAAQRRREPARRPDHATWSARPSCSPTTRWSPSVVLLLNAGHEASVNVFGNGLVAMLAPRSAPGARTCRADGRGDAALRLRAAAVRAHRDRGRSRSADVDRRARARRSPPCSARPTATRRSSTTPTPSTSTATPTRTSPSASACTSASGAPLARMELVESLTALFATVPRPAAGGRPREPRARSCCGATGRCRCRR